MGRYRLAGFVGEELPYVLALADVVVSRSGAGTLAELTALGMPAVFVPLASSAGQEQAHNARHLERFKGVVDGNSWASRVSRMNSSRCGTAGPLAGMAERPTRSASLAGTVCP